MLALRRLTVETEILKWVLLTLIAAAIAMLLATRMAGADAPQTAEHRAAPGLLPHDMNDGARPMDEAAAPPFYPEVGPLPPANDMNQVLWRILELHRRGMPEEAIAAWQTANVPCDTDVWKQTALGAAYLQAGQVEEARDHLTAALEIEPNNAVAHYYVALLRLTEAQTARTWNDAIGPPALMLVALPAIVPNTRGMYELAAIQELEQAIELAAQIDFHAPLARIAQVDMVPVITPTVGDLLAALGADHYPARAHNILGFLYLERGHLEIAEQHVDAAANEQLHGPFAYRDLAAAYEHADRPDDALRTYLKAFRHGDPNLVPALGILRNGWMATGATR